MALTKNQLIAKVVEETGYTIKDAAETVEILLELIKSTLASREDVLISGFGKFCVKGKNARKGRNPATGDDMLLDSRNVISFKCSSKLRDRINKGK